MFKTDQELYQEGAQDEAYCQERKIDKCLSDIKSHANFIKFKQESIDKGWRYMDEVCEIWKKLRMGPKGLKLWHLDDGHLHDISEKMSQDGSHKYWEYIS